MEVRYSTQFKKQYKKLPKKMREQFGKRLVQFIHDQNDPQLHVHKLSGRCDGLWSINITGDIRAVFDRYYNGVVVFEAIGSHSELYS
jgi:addiction module RelE/StbE family toxin